MPTLKVRCPECGASLRQTIDAVDEPTEFTLTCAKCQHEFVAEAEPEEEPIKSVKKSAKAMRRRDDYDDDDDNTPRKKKKKQAADSPNTKLIVGGIAAGVLVIGGVIAAVLALGGKDKNKDSAKTDPAPEQQQQPVTPPSQQPVKPPPGTQPPIKQPPVIPPGPGGTGGPIGPTGPIGPKPKPKDPNDDGLSAFLPPPPKLHMSGSAMPAAGKLDTRGDKPLPMPPLSPDEDPFVRAKKFTPDRPVPPLPKLPDAKLRPLLTLDAGGHSAFISKVFITPDGDKVITVGEDKAVRVWDIQSGDTINTFHLPAGPGDEGSLLAAALSASGKRLAVAGIPLKSVKQGQIPIFIINVENGTLVKTISAAREVVTAVDFSANGNQIAVGCADGSVQLFDVASGSSTGLVDRAHRGVIREVRYSPNPKAKVLATLGSDGAVRMWDLSNSARNYTLDVRDLGPQTISWTSTGQILAVGGKSGEIMLFSVDNGRMVRSLPKHDYNGAPIQVNQMQFLANDHDIVYGGVGGGGWAGVVSTDTGAVKVSFTGHSNTVMAVNVSADGKFGVSSGGNQNETYVWSVKDGKTISRLSGAGSGVWGIGWAKDGKSVAWGTDNLRDRDGHTRLESSFRFDDFGIAGAPDESKYEQQQKADKTYAVVKTGEKELRMGPIDGPYVLFKFITNERIYSYSILPNQRMAVVGGAVSLALVDPANGKVLREFVGHTGNVLAVAPSPDGKYFITGSSDQTMRVWLPEHEEPLLSIFVLGQEWIAWTAQGYYACSPHGEKLIAWQINTTASKFPQVHPAARFRPSMYQPALIKYVVPSGNLSMAMAMARTFDKALVETTSVADIVPPEVTIDSPSKEDLVIDQDKYTVKANAKGSAKQPVTAMRLLVDGRPFHGAEGVKRFEKPLPTADATWEVTLTPGPHTFAVIAETGVSKSLSKVATLKRSGVPPKADLFILAVGVSDYPGKMKLRYGASDAKLLAKAFQEKSKSIFGKIEVRVLTDGDATKKGIQDGLDWLKSKMTPKDVGIVSFSGHGTRDPFGRFYMVPAGTPEDMSLADVAQSCFSGDEFKARLDAMPGRLVAILDACHSGMVAEKLGPARADNLVRDLAAEDSGVVVMCASLGRELSTESNVTKAGFYTFGIVEGLSGHADMDEDGIIYIHELDYYASYRVRQISKGVQNPTTGRPSTVRPFPIASVEKRP